MEAFYKVRDFSDIREMLDMSVELFGERNAFEVKRDGKHYNITYNEYIELINTMSSALLSGGFKDASVAICSDNRYEYCLTYLSVICSGGVIVPVDKELHMDDICGILDVSETRLLFCDRKRLEAFDIERLNGIRVVCFDSCEDIPGAETMDSFLEKGKEIIASGLTPWKDVIQDPDKLCTLLFTSGTTGISKGVMLCQRNFVFEIKAAMGVIKIEPEDCGISLLPLHHTFESSIMIFFAPYCGAKVTFCEGFQYVLKNMKEFNPSVFIAVPQVLETVHKKILRQIKKKKFGEQKFKVGKALCRAAAKVNIDLKKVIFKEIQDTFGGNMRMIICGGAPIDPEIIRDFDSFGIQVVFGYGLTECAPLAIINNDRVRSCDSVGVPLPGVEARIDSPDENGIGEVCVKGDMVMLGYYKNKEETSAVIDPDGFFHTGDLGYTDENGLYHLTGRCKNVIVTSNGKNIYPEELEYHLSSSPLIDSCMVEEITDKKGEPAIHAQILPEFEEIKDRLSRIPSAEELNSIIQGIVNEVNSKLPGFKRIKSFTVRETDFIRTTAKKIKRNDNKS